MQRTTENIQFYYCLTIFLKLGENKVLLTNFGFWIKLDVDMNSEMH